MELVDSVDELRTSSSIRGISMPNLEVLDARIASALNKIKLKTVLDLYDLETHQKKLGPDYHRLKAMVKRSIEQEIRNKNFGIRKWKF